VSVGFALFTCNFALLNQYKHNNKQMQENKINFETMPSVISEIFTKVENIEKFINSAPQQTNTSTDTEPLIFGISGLAEFLHVTNVTAQRIKNSGKIPFSQAERTIIFNKEDVLKALSNKKR
jgi:hypothetical protein